MEKIQFDVGVKSYKLGDGVLRFNPGDPNVYARFLEAVEKLKNIEAELVENAQKDPNGETFIQLMAQADRQMKQLLDWVFGQGNDFDRMLGGVNLLAVAANGERVVTNLLTALEPVILAGAKACAGEVSRKAVAGAKRRRDAQ